MISLIIEHLIFQSFLLINFIPLYCLIRFQILQVRTEEENRDPRIIKVFKTQQYQTVRNGIQFPLSPRRKNRKQKLSIFLFSDSVESELSTASRLFTLKHSL